MAVPPAYHESLPYIDPEPSSEALSAARALIAAEQSTFSPPPPSSSSPQEPNFSPAIAAELARIASSAPSQPLDLSRYEAQELPPPPTKKSTRSKKSSAAASAVEASRQPLSNAFISSSYLSSRAQNLSLLDSHGRNAWLLSNYHLEAELRSLERDLAATKRDMDLLNAARASRQNEVKGEMQGLEQNWREGVGRVLETEIAVQELREQIRQELRSRAAAAEHAAA
ncbi:breast carcinoma amplified sequence 2 (BCAS2) domain-containing protein [Trichoderma breve]|uniref:Breast carcinoma amplified sequence 2 (BCAS2) domain-containing protein n=1 Tax=Trichoderma breve TaxID=2034170 RepID=A0A9W9BBL3_9HYPO|nr:breast carcinoma amplified sequence 2 (BCAS2) domain-containing protein [Trichoderma breve]KAJ4860247.1 breast carcinoma amplified sequence 2 (BCAS2) domain-containing protein [Trichoderma breve]